MKIDETVNASGTDEQQLCRDDILSKAQKHTGKMDEKERSDYKLAYMGGAFGAAFVSLIFMVHSLFNNNMDLAFAFGSVIFMALGVSDLLLGIKSQNISLKLLNIVCGIILIIIAFLGMLTYFQLV